MTDQNYIETLLRLLQVPKLSPQHIDQLFTHISPEQLCNYDQEALQHIGWTTQQIHAWFAPNYDYIDPVLKWIEQPEQYLIHYWHPAYPDLLKQISTAPPILFVKGNLACLSQAQIAIVGSRDCSHYGEYWATYFASELSALGFTITSGLALGIDGIAHQAIIAQQGQTIAVLGSGLDNIYPAKHQQLAEQILTHHGALVSEFLPSQAPIAKNFPRRNRIISGLSLATLVIEATQHSGSLITAHYALEQNRDIFALPGNIQNEYSQGCHQLIKQGAMLVENVSDIMENLSYTGYQSAMGILAPTAYYPPNKPLITPLSSTSKTKVQPEYPELFAQIPHTGISLDQLSEQLALSVDQLLIQLLALQLQDLIYEQNGIYLRR